MKKIPLFLLLAFVVSQASGQKYFTKGGEISFYSDAPMEKIEAHNKRVTAILDTETGRIEFAALIKAFQFEKALMEEHFNENYLESGKYPKSVFKGSIEEAGDIDFSKDGKHEVTVTGDLEMHGITKPLTANAVLEVSGGKIKGMSTFIVKCADYEIKIPKVVADNIAKEIEVKVLVDLEPLTR